MHIDAARGSHDQSRKCQVRAAQLSIDQDADIVGGDLGPDAGQQAPGAMRTWEVQTETLDQGGEGCFDGLCRWLENQMRALCRSQTGGVSTWVA